MSNVGDSFDWALDQVIKACEEKRLDPPAPPLLICTTCNGEGLVDIYTTDPLGEKVKEWAICSVCNGAGEYNEPEEWFEKD